MAGMINFSQEEFDSTFGVMDSVLNKGFSEEMSNVREAIANTGDDNELTNQLIGAFDNFTTNYNAAADAYDKVVKNLSAVSDVMSFLSKYSIGEVQKGSEYSIQESDAAIVTGGSI